MVRHLLLLTAAMVVAAAAAQANAIVTRVYHSTLYSPSLVHWVGAGRDFPLVVVGNPTLATDAAWQETVASSLNLSQRAAFTRFTTTPDESARDNFHLVLVFGAPAGTSGHQACAGETLTMPAAPGERTAILAAFCNRTRLVSTARASTPAILSLDAAHLQPALATLLVQTLPLRDPNADRSRRTRLLFP